MVLLPCLIIPVISVSLWLSFLYHSFFPYKSWVKSFFWTSPQFLSFPHLSFLSAPYSCYSCYCYAIRVPCVISEQSFSVSLPSLTSVSLPDYIHNAVTISQDVPLLQQFSRECSPNICLQDSKTLATVNQLCHPPSVFLNFKSVQNILFRLASSQNGTHHRSVILAFYKLLDLPNYHLN